MLLIYFLICAFSICATVVIAYCIGFDEGKKDEIAECGAAYDAGKSVGRALAILESARGRDAKGRFTKGQMRP